MNRSHISPIRRWDRLALAALASAALTVFLQGASVARAEAPPIQFVFTSDAHYGLTRSAFRGQVNVRASQVNRALVASINALPGLTYPRDGGLRAGSPIGPLDFVAEGGDVANRSEVSGGVAIQSATTSWGEFVQDYIQGISTVTPTGVRTPVYVVPGNHDLSNAVGFHQPMQPTSDAASLVGIYNLMMRPDVARSPASFDPVRDRMQRSITIAGIHFMFITLWPDAPTREWMERDLRTTGPDTPAILFTHDQPEGESKHFENPNGAHDINARDKFENLLRDRLVDGPTIDTPNTLEQRALEAFLRRHPSLTAYFHGNSNWNQFYEWTGPSHSVALHTFRVDSPMKGAVSATDESVLSFHVVLIDPQTQMMTVRECRWNAPTGSTTGIAWGGSVTVSLWPRTVRPHAP